MHDVAVIGAGAAGLMAAIFATALRAAQPMDAAQLQQALKKLTVVGSVMYVAAHPDDENTALIAYLGNERLLGIYLMLREAAQN